MPTGEKERQVEELKDRFVRCTIAVATDYTGLPVNTLTELRQRLRDQGMEYRVVKNTLAYVAADEISRPQIKDIVQGPTGLAFGYGDPVEAAKTLTDYIRSTRSTLSIKGALVDNRILGPGEVAAFAQLPPKPQLLAHILGQMQTPISRLLAVLNGPVVGLATLLQRRLEQLRSEGE